MTFELQKKLRDAAWNGDAGGMRSSLEAGASINPSLNATATAQEWGYPPAPTALDIPLHAAVMGDSIECVRIAIAAGALVDRRDSRGRTALAHSRSAAVAATLLNAGADPQVVDSGGYDVLDCVLGVDGPEVDDENDQPASDEPLLIARMLLDHGAELHRIDKGWTRLWRAAFCKGLRAVESLLVLGHSLEPNDSGTALHAIAWHWECGDERDAVAIALMHRLIEAGCDIDAVDRHGCTALHLSVAGDGDNSVAARVLLDAGADPNTRNHEGETPLVHMFYQNFGYELVVPLLLERGADPLIRDQRGKHAIDAARHIAEGGQPPWRENATTGWGGIAAPDDPLRRVIGLMEKVAGLDCSGEVDPAGDSR